MNRLSRAHMGYPPLRRFVVVAVAVAAFAALLAAAALADEHEKLTGLDRAAQATVQGLEKSQGKAADAPGRSNRAAGVDKADEKPTGREQAAASIRATLARGNGNGNAFGRGHAEVVLGILLGEIPGRLMERDHGPAVREMVHAYNALRKGVDGGS